MRLFAFIALALLAAIATACDYSRSYSQVGSARPRGRFARRWAHQLDTKDTPGLAKFGHHRWPTNDVGETEINYCFETGDTKDKMYARVRMGVMIWETALGGPGEKNGHRIRFKPVTEPCFKPKTGEWNDKIPGDALIIRLITGNEKNGLFVNYAYNTEQEGGKGINHLWLYEDVEDWMVAHEIGHVLGMMHEHQRPDRDDHVHWNCWAMRGFDKLRKYLDKNNVNVDNVELCNKPEMYDEYKEQSLEFAPMSFQKFNSDMIEAKQDYDTHSIMHFTSDAFAKYGGNCMELKEKEHCVLMKYTTDKHDADAPMEIIGPNKLPSELDVKFLKALYKWGDK